MNLGEVVDEKLETGFVDGQKKQEKTRKRVATFKDQVEKGVKDMKVSTIRQYTKCTAVLYELYLHCCTHWDIQL